MNRRSFFNLLGKAVLGTIITLKISNTLAPIIEVIKPKITFRVLDEAYRNCCRGIDEPKFIYVSYKTYEDIVNILSPHFYTISGLGLVFHSAEIQPLSNGFLDNNQINIQGEYFGTSGRFYF